MNLWFCCVPGWRTTRRSRKIALDSRSRKRQKARNWRSCGRVKVTSASTRVELPIPTCGTGLVSTVSFLRSFSVFGQVKLISSFLSKLRGPAVILSKWTKSYNMELGGPMKLSCEVGGHPIPTITMYKGRFYLPFNLFSELILRIHQLFSYLKYQKDCCGFWSDLVMTDDSIECQNFVCTFYSIQG